MYLYLIVNGSSESRKLKGVVALINHRVEVKTPHSNLKKLMY
ncbi:hypothetical protein B6N60_00850 [Richelia sinica FACHB-800]|uniref:Uncharacterized protein n=1 Tax=Richelia sinica FACHB-800 TaxID=1357546 RepID=A0A975Y3I5_9NOST|nr:hypothetical protein B6N60_00850 [Richelia sinica FACHB-800]